MVATHPSQVTIVCPACRQLTTVSTANKGRTAPCSNCFTHISVPMNPIEHPEKLIDATCPNCSTTRKTYAGLIGHQDVCLNCMQHFDITGNQPVGNQILPQIPCRWVEEIDNSHDDNGNPVVYRQRRIYSDCPQCGDVQIHAPKDIGYSFPCDVCQHLVVVSKPTSDIVQQIVNNKPEPQKKNTCRCLYCGMSRNSFAIVCHHCGRDIYGRIGQAGGNLWNMGPMFTVRQG